MPVCWMVVCCRIHVEIGVGNVQERKWPSVSVFMVNCMLEYVVDTV